MPSWLQKVIDFLPQVISIIQSIIIITHQNGLQKTSVALKAMKGQAK